MPLRFLIADDYSAHLKLIGNIVGFLGGEMRCASDGREVLALADKGDFDVLLLDLQMPNMGGIAVADRLMHRWQLREPRPRIVAVTGDNSEGTRALCRAIGMDGFIAKPYDAPDLRNALQKVIIHGHCWADGAPCRQLDVVRFENAMKSGTLDTWSGFEGWARIMREALREIAGALAQGEAGRAIMRLDECRTEFANMGFVRLHLTLNRVRHQAAVFPDVTQIKWIEGAQADLALCLDAARTALEEVETFCVAA